MRCARGTSIFSTVSTMSVLSLPEGVSITLPSGIRDSLAAMSVLMPFRMAKAARWESTVDAVPSATRPACPNRAIRAKRNRLSGVAVPGIQIHDHV